MNYKLILPATVIVFGIGIYTGKLFYAKTETIEIEREVIKRDTVTVIKEIVRPDGTRETETISTDKSKESKDSKTSVIVAAPPQPQWHLSISGAANLQNSINVLPSSMVYGLQIERRILGPFSIGARIQTDKQIGLVVGYEF